MIAIDIPKYEFVQVRKYAAEMPIGHAHMGAPFKQKNGPAIGVAAAVGSISTGVAAISAGSALLGGIMIAGGIASGLGALTGNKTLSTIGSVAGLASFGVGSFVDSAGGFINPFSSEAGQGFFNSVTGSAVKSVFDNIKGAIGITDALPNATDASGLAKNIVDNAKPVEGSLMSAGTEQLTNVNGISTSATGRAFDAVSSASGSIFGKDGILNNQGALGLIGGLGEGYMKGRELEQLEPLRDAQVNATNANADATRQQMGLIAQRQKNMQFQPNAAATVNQDANLYNGPPGQGTAGKYAVVIDGTVQYVSQQEYDALRAQGNQPVQGA